MKCSTIGQEFENEMNSNDMDSEMADMDSMGEGNQNGGMRAKITRKTQTYPTAPVRDLVGVRFGVEKEDDKQMIQTRSKIRKGMSRFRRELTTRILHAIIN